jgi:putative addiction module component (TIGR02574 family)
MANELTQELLQLSPAERIQLAEALWDSVARETAPLSDFEAQQTEQEYRPEKLKENLSERHFEELPIPGLDSETDLVVSLPPKSRRAIQLQVTAVRKAEPRVIFDSSARTGRSVNSERDRNISNPPKERLTCNAATFLVTT